MKRVFLSIFLLAWMLAFLGAPAVFALQIPQPQQKSFDKRLSGTIPDLDQNRDYTGNGIAEQTWCAPTAAADSVWYFGKGGYPKLIPAGVNDTVKADNLITALGGLMKTADPKGTTIANAVNGLQQHFNNNYPGTFTVTWNNAWTLPDNQGAPSAQNLWNWMTTELYNCSDVLPILWLPAQHQGPPVDDSEIVQTDLDSVGGHLVMMTGYNIVNYPGTIDIFDPDDNVPQGIHVFPPPNIAPVNWNLAIVGQNISPQGTALSINGGAGGWIVGGIVATPEPTCLLLLGLGALPVLRRRKR
jgi:hypothetical protein